MTPERHCRADASPSTGHGAGLRSGRQAVGVTVILPTLARASRSSQLRRAVESARAQRGVDVRVLLVVNGRSHDEGLLRSLERSGDVTIDRLASADLPAAISHGRSRVDTEYFAFLDDDDEYLEDTLHRRVGPLLDDPGCALTVSNGHHVSEDGDGRRSCSMLADGDPLSPDPLRALLRENWLTSCGGLYRSDRVPEAIFADPVPYYEWTSIAFRLALHLDADAFRFVDEPTVRIHDTPDSRSDSAAYRTGELALLDTMLAEELPDDVAERLEEKKSEVLHNLSWFHLQREDRKTAWRYHVRTLVRRGGWRYLPYTRKLLLPSIYAE